MIKVDNKKTIKHIADISFKADRMRNIFAVMAITLTSILFCSLFTIGSSLLVSMEESTMRQVGGNAHGGFKCLTEEQYERLKLHPDIKEISYSVVLGIAENRELGKRPTEIRYANDELEAEMMFSMPTTGRLPINKNELATDRIVLERLGIPAKLGETVSLQYSICGKEYVEEFILVGFWDGDVIMNTSQVWLSKEYVETILCTQDMSMAEDIIGSIQADVKFNNSWNIESKLIKVITESGYDTEEIRYGVNWAYTGGSLSLDAETTSGGIICVLFIVLCGYLMISNVFLISVMKDVRFYGLLKTIGTTDRQSKTLIRRQAMKISLFGIPIGLLAGGITGSILVPFILENLNVNIVKVSVPLWVFLFATVFTLATVFVSIRKAEKLAAKVSPIEALRSTDVIVSKRRKQKSGEKISLWKMAVENVGRNRKRVILVTISLSLSLIILNGAYTMANSFDIEKYLSNMLAHDFVVGDVSWFNVYSHYTNQDTLNSEFLAELSSCDGIESLERIYFSEKNCKLDEHWDDMAERVQSELNLEDEWLKYLKEEIQTGDAVYHVYGIEDATWDDFEVWEGELDLEKLHSGEYVAVSPYDSEGKLSAYEVGDKIEVFNSNGESRSCEIIAIASIPYNISIQHTHPVDVNIYLSADVFLDKVEKKCPMIITIDVADSNINEMEQFLERYCKIQNTDMQYSSRALYVAEYESTQKMYKLVGTVAAVLLALIGIANFANTSIASIMTRKRELAVLESIGMTIKQQKKMLVLEGMVYMVAVFGFTWTAGALLGDYVLSNMLSDSGFFTIKFTVIPSFACMPIFISLAILIPVLSQKYVNRESVVERLRMAE